MHPLSEMLRANELWLMRRVRDYALKQDYTRYTSTLQEAWRVSIVGITDSIVAALEISERPWELSPEDNFLEDPIASFGIMEAQKHRLRGVSLEMFLGLMKYYRQTFLDRVKLSFPNENESLCLFIERIFDRLEIAFCSEWSRTETVARSLDELQVANREITNEKNKFLTIFESLPTPAFLLDNTNGIVHMNRAGARMLDTKATSGGHYYSSPEQRIPFPWLADELVRFRADAEEFEPHSLIETADGRKRHFRVSFSEMQDISFKYPGTVVIMRDITALIDAERSLKKSESEYRTTVDGLLVGVVVHDSDSKILITNHEASKILGLSQDQMIGKDAVYPGLSFIHEDHTVLTVDEHPVNRVLSTRQPVTNYILGINHPERDRVTWINVNAVPLFSSVGELEKVIVNFEDVTERKALDEELQSKVKDLEEVVYVASHDLRSPVVTVLGFSGVLAEAFEGLTERLEESGQTGLTKADLEDFINDSTRIVELIHTSGTNMETLLDGLLQVSRLSRIVLHKDTIDMNNLLSRVVSESAFNAEQQGSNISIGDLPPCQGDEGQVLQLFNNLLGNALKYSHPDRAAVITISGYREDGHSVYCVEDNGLGIAPEYHESIFQMFHQLDSEKLGQGLGLSIVRKIVERHNGRIWLESELGQGSRFFVRL